MSNKDRLRRFGGGIAFLAVATAVAGVDPPPHIEVIYTKKTGDAKALVPGAKNLDGTPAVTEWRAIEDFSLSPDGDRWMVKGRTQLGSDAETVMVLGGGATGTMFAQEGQPFIGAAVDELYDFFDSPSPVSFDTLGNFVFSARAKGGATSDDEKVIFVDSLGNQTLILQQGDAALGLTDNPPGNSGDELFGNSIGSVQILETADQVQFVNTPITNLHSTRYPAFFRGDTAFRQSGISAIDGEIWDNFDLSDAGGTPDGAHWYAEGDTENANTAIDDILAVDDVVVLREGSTVGGSSVIYADLFATRMSTNGNWISRGDDPSDNDWMVINGVLVAKTGDPIVTGSTENWGAILSAIAINDRGDYILIGNTDVGNTAIDEVMVLNGTRVVAREGDAVDLDGNGLPDDDAFIGRGVDTNAAFAANDVLLTENRTVYFIANLRDSAGNDLNSNPVFGTPDAFLRIQLCPGDLNNDLQVDLTDLSALLVNFGLGGVPPSGGDIDGDGDCDLDDLSRLLVRFGLSCE